jgi:hypothetical protein
VDITYKYRDPQIDVVRPRRRKFQEQGILEEYFVLSDAAPPVSEDKSSDSDLDTEVKTRLRGLALVDEISNRIREQIARDKAEGKLPEKRNPSLGFMNFVIAQG